MTTKHAIRRLGERIGIRDPELAEAFAESASERGIPPSGFPDGSPVRVFLESKTRGGNRVVAYMGIAVVFAPDGNAVTAYPLPAILLEHYRKETNKND